MFFANTIGKGFKEVAFLSKKRKLGTVVPIIPIGVKLSV